MADKTPVLVQQHSPTSQTADDGTYTDITAGMTDDDTGTNVFKIGKGDDAFRAEFQGDHPPAVDDTITVFLGMGMSFTAALELYAHIDTNSVTATGKIVIASPTLSGSNVFTLTQAFIDEIVQFNTDRWAVRVVIDDFADGDAGVTEVQADITTADGVSTGSSAGAATATAESYAPAFPSVQSTNTSFEETNVTSHTVDLPAGIVSGDLLIILFCNDGSGGTLTWPSGYTEFFDKLGDLNQMRLTIAYRQADGTEGSTITVTTTGTAQGSAHASYRITGHENPATQAPEASSGVGPPANTSPDPDSLTPTGGVKDYLWLACHGHDRLGTTNAFPTNYTNGISTQGTTPDSAAVGSAERQLNAASEDPGAFTISTSDEWVACTVAIYPTGENIVTGDGSSSGTAAATGDGVSTVAADGSSTGLATTTGDGISTVAGAGSATGVATAEAVGQAAGNVVTGDGSSAGTSTVTGDGVSTAAADGTSTSVATASADGNSTVRADGSSTGGATVTGDGAATFRADGASAGAATATADGISTSAQPGTSAGVATVTADGVSTSAAPGAATGVATTTADGVSTFAAPGTSSGTSSITADGVSTAAGDGVSTGGGTAVGDGVSTATADGASSSVATVSAVPSISGLAAGTATATADGISTVAQPGVATGTATVSGDGASTSAQSGTAAGTSTAEAVGQDAGSAATTGDGAASGTATVSGTGHERVTSVDDHPDNIFLALGVSEEVNLELILVDEEGAVNLDAGIADAVQLLASIPGTAVNVNAPMSSGDIELKLAA